MRIKIVIEDKLVLLDQVPVRLPDLDWALFDGDPSSPWDDIHAVEYDSERGMGTVEYKTVRTQQLTRHDIKPPDWYISKVDFDNYFAWVLPYYEEALTKIKQEHAEEEANKKAQEEQAEKLRAEAEANRAEHALKPDFRIFCRDEFGTQ